MGGCFSGLLRRIFGGTPVTIPDEEQAVPVHRGFVQSSSEGCQTAPAISVESKDMRMLVFAKCISQERSNDTVRVTVYYTDEDNSQDPVKDAAAMEANKHAGRLVGQKPVFIYNNEKHVLMEIGDVVLPSSVISEGSKVRDLLRFKSIWRRHNGQSSTLVLKRGDNKEKGVNFHVKFQQDEVVVDVHVVEELRHLIMDPERALPSRDHLDSGIMTSSGDHQYPHASIATSDSDQDYQAQGARPKTHGRKRKIRKKKHSPRAPRAPRAHLTPSSSKFKRRCDEESQSEEAYGSDDSCSQKENQRTRRRADKVTVSSSKASSRPAPSRAQEDAVPSCSYASNNSCGTSDTAETIVASKTVSHEVTSDKKPIVKKSAAQGTDSTLKQNSKGVSQGDSSHHRQSDGGEIMQTPPVASDSFNAVQEILPESPHSAQRSIMQIASSSTRRGGQRMEQEEDSEFPDYAIISPVSRTGSFTDSGIQSATNCVIYNIQNFNISQQHTVNTSNPAIQDRPTELYACDRFPEVLLEPLKRLDLGDWKMLASHLNLDKFIEAIETEVKNHGKSPIRLLLDKWWQVKGQKAELADVKAALKEMERKDVLEALEDAEKEWKTASQAPHMEDDT